ncbi:penicillin-binding protein 1B [Solilutibacter tolerans]|uniref:Penicillin-binding protein 1B n=1 Tax=Solilutibacter tolerans TaxID=1604334 RepID=A0A1N6TZ68_9GAMM|nr:penicillin-binding protein 1B [Lysobacter tolerans]SIQ58577.1 penicillin-binding protein 1B [Lysobacter tolerans]
MAKYDYDDPDFDDEGDHQTVGSGWGRRLLVAFLALVGIGLGFLIPYTLYLNHQVSQRFGELKWQLPTRVYARPLQLEPGIALDANTLKTELDAAAYRDDGAGSKPGSYARNGNTFTISSRGYFDVEGRIAPQRIQVTMSGGRVASVRQADRKSNLRAARLDPARIATLYGQKQEERRLVSLNEVPEALVTGLQAVEDRDFARHHGIDISGMTRGIWVSLRSRGKSLQGGSTLTQQLARSGLLGIGSEVTFSRKFKEILYALILEARYDKRTILETYFNQVYWGQRGSQAIHGVAAASEFWFDRNLDQLNTEQIALLIALVNGPSWYDARRNPARATERRNFVLGEMLETGVIDQKEHDRAVKAPLGVSKEPGGAAPNRFPAYVDLVRRQLVRDYPADSLQGAGLSVMTAMSPAAQGYAEGAVTRTLKSLGPRKNAPLEAGLVMTDVHTGQVVAAVGSRDFSNPGFNRAVEAQRPVGSIIKPFVYLLALAQPGKWSLASYVDDSPLTIRQGDGQRWSPKNSDGRSHGTVRLIDALAQSYNLATVRLGMDVGPERVAQLTRTLAGIEPQTNPSLLLGSTDQSPYAMAQLYQFLASGGEVQPLHAVRGVLDPNGRALNRYDKAPAPAQKGDAIAARLVTIALQQAVSSGTGRQLVSDGLGRLKAAGKTGTSNDSRDSWFAGWTGDHLAVVWVGNDQNKPTGLYGATGAMRVWSGIFSRLPSKPLEVGDDGIDWQWVAGSHATDASCPGVRRFAFVQGYAPSYEQCVIAPPPVPVDEYGNPIEPIESGQPESGSGFWRDLFGMGGRRAPQDPATTPPPAQQQPPAQPPPSR